MTDRNKLVQCNAIWKTETLTLTSISNTINSFMHLTDSEPLIYEISQNDEYGLRIEETLDVVCQVISSPFFPRVL